MVALFRDSGIYHLDSFSLKTLYRALEILGESFGQIIDYVQDYLFSHYSFETTDEQLDWTSLILWGNKAELGLQETKRCILQSTATGKSILDGKIVVPR